MSLRTWLIHGVLGLPVNLKRYGGTPDGTTDNSVALQAAMDVATKYNVSIRLGPGVYRVKSPFSLDEETP